MKKLIFVVFIILSSCSKLIDKPKNLLSKEEMAELVAEFSLNDQLNNYIPGTNIENATRITLKNKNIKAQDFTESYKYYLATKDLNQILDEAQKIILNKDPDAKIFIQKNLIKEDSTLIAQ